MIQKDTKLKHATSNGSFTMKSLKNILLGMSIQADSPVGKSTSSNSQKNSTTKFGNGKMTRQS